MAGTCSWRLGSMANECCNFTACWHYDVFMWYLFLLAAPSFASLAAQNFGDLGEKNGTFLEKNVLGSWIFYFMAIYIDCFGWWLGNQLQSAVGEVHLFHGYGGSCVFCLCDPAVETAGGVKSFMRPVP